MRILLINPIIRISVPSYCFPLGLAYIAAVLEQAGHAVEVLDVNAHRYSPREVEEIIQKADFDFAGITGLITEYRQIKWLVDKLKRYHPSKLVFLGGGLATAAPDYVLQNTRVDIVVIGEGEITLKELVGRLEAGSGFASVAGLVFRAEGRIVTTEPRAYLADLDKLPLPLYEKFPVGKYAAGEKLGFSYPARALNIITSRGCPYQCIYCYHGISGYKYRKRSADNIVEEMAFLKDRYGLHGILFSDDTFVLDRTRVLDFCEKLRKRRLGLKWAANARVDLVDEELLKEMKSAGCVSVSYGIESGSPKILKNMRKGFTAERAEQAVRLTRKVGLQTLSYFMIGMVGETRETINETKEFCKRIRNQTQFALVTPFPGTELFDIAKSRNLLPDFGTMLKKWDIWNYNLLVNMSELSDSELLALKRAAEEEINAVSVKKGRELWIFFRDFGPRLTLKRLFYYLLRLLMPSRDELSRSYSEAERQTAQWQQILAA